MGPSGGVGGGWVGWPDVAGARPRHVYTWKRRVGRGGGPAECPLQAGTVHIFACPFLWVGRAAGARGQTAGGGGPLLVCPLSSPPPVWQQKKTGPRAWPPPPAGETGRGKRTNKTGAQGVSPWSGRPWPCGWECVGVQEVPVGPSGSRHGGWQVCAPEAVWETGQCSALLRDPPLLPTRAHPTFPCPRTHSGAETGKKASSRGAKHMKNGLGWGPRRRDPAGGKKKKKKKGID